MRYPSQQTVVQVPSMLAFEDDYYAIGSVTLAMGFPRNVRAGTIPSHSRLNTMPSKFPDLGMVSIS